MLLSRLPNGTPEIFASVQGEGVTVGVPSVFVRLASCGLRCTFCDTRYTWDWSGHDPQATTLRLEVHDVAARIAEHALGATNVVVTGGEPLLQQEAVTELAHRLKHRGLRIEVETSGTLSPTRELTALVDQWNVSPKLASSGNEHALREVPGALTWFATAPMAWFKFVICRPDDVDEALALGGRYSIPRERILLMPEGADPQTVVERSRWLVERCQLAGVRMGTRLHVLIWGAERGR